MAFDYIPAGYHSVTPYMVIKGAKDALDFYARAFGAVEKLRLDGPGGIIMHAEMQIGNSMIMLADEMEQYKSASSFGGSPVSMMIYVEDVDAAVRQAIEAGATEAKPVEDQFYGDRTGSVVDPFGYMWTLATVKEQLSQEEIQRRLEEMMKQ